MKIILLFLFASTLTLVARAEQLRGAAAAAAISQEHRQEQAAAPTTELGTIKELRWVNADSNQRNFVVDGSFVVPINDNEEFADLIDGYEVDPNVGLSVEAITEGSIGSIMFTYNGKTVIENNAPYALCANSGIDFLPCTGLNSGRDDQHDQRITAQVYSGKGATGVAGPVLSTVFRYLYKAEPLGNLIVYNADDETDELDAVFGTATINITQTPRIAIFVNAWSARFRWGAQSVRFNYDNGAQFVTENVAPFVFPGNSGTDYFGMTPTVGNHTLVATIHSKKNLQGQNTTWTMNIRAVV